MGLGVSLVVHGAVLGLGKFGIGGAAEDSRSRQQVSTQLELPENAIEVVRIKPTESTARPEATVRPLELELPEVGPPAELPARMALASPVRIQAPVVPRPPMRALTEPTGFAPMQELDRPLVFNDDRGDERGGFLGLFRTSNGGQCGLPTASIFRRFPGNR